MLNDLPPPPPHLAGLTGEGQDSADVSHTHLNMSTNYYSIPAGHRDHSAARETATCAATTTAIVKR